MMAAGSGSHAHELPAFRYGEIRKGGLGVYGNSTTSPIVMKLGLRGLGAVNEVDKIVIGLLAKLAATTERPSIDLWERLVEFEPIEAKTLARRKRNARAYQKAKRKKEEEVLNSLNDRLKTSEKTENVLNGSANVNRYLAKVGTGQYDAWNSWSHDKKGKSLPYSDELKGWYVPSEWPPGSPGERRHDRGLHG
jgi:hypothetical protein